MNKYRVVIADDQKLIREGLGNMIDWNSIGYEIAGYASNGEEAFQLAEGCDLIISDIRMPVLDGIELARKIRQKQLPVEIIMISGYREFEYARKAIEYGVKNYIVKPISSDKLIESLLIIHEELDEAQEQRIQDALLKLFYSYGKSSIKYGKELENLGINLQYTCFSVCIMLLDLSEDASTQALGGNDQDESVISLVKQYTSKTSSCYAIPVGFRDNMIILLFCLNQKDPILIRRYLTGLYAHLSSFMPTVIKTVIGPIAEDIRDIFMSFSRARQTIEEEVFFTSRDSMIVGPYHNGRNDGSDNCLIIDTEKLLFSARNLQWDKIQNEIENFINYCEKSELTLNSIRLTAMHLLLRLYDLIAEDKSDFNPSISSYFRRIDQIASASEFHEFISDICKIVYEHLNCRNILPISDKIDEIITYIESNYNKHINIKEISQAFFTSPAYLGRLFEKKMNVGFNKYLNDIRIRNAAKLLRETDWKIYDICTYVGYHSLKYFYKLFKEMTGMTPMDYRLSNIKQ